MKQIRIYKDIECLWTVTTNGQALSLEGTPLRVYVVRPDNTRANLTGTLSVSGAQLAFRYPHELHTALGVHRLELWAYPDTPRQTIADLPGAFRLVALSTLEGGEDPAALATEHLTLQTADIRTGQAGTTAATGTGTQSSAPTATLPTIRTIAVTEMALAGGMVVESGQRYINLMPGYMGGAVQMLNTPPTYTGSVEHNGETLPVSNDITAFWRALAEAAAAEAWNHIDSLDTIQAVLKTHREVLLEVYSPQGEGGTHLTSMRADVIRDGEHYVLAYELANCTARLHFDFTGAAPRVMVSFYQFADKGDLLEIRGEMAGLADEARTMLAGLQGQPGSQAGGAGTPPARYPLCAVVHDERLYLRGDIRGMLDAGLKPVLFRKIRKTMYYRTNEGDDTHHVKRMGWNRMCTEEMVRISEDGLVSARGSDFDGEGDFTWLDTFSDAPEAFVHRTRADSVKVRWGRTARKIDGSCVLPYAIAFVAPDYNYAESDRKPFDWTILRTDLARFRVMQKTVVGPGKVKSHFWGFAAE